LNICPFQALRGPGRDHDRGAPGPRHPGQLACGELLARARNINAEARGGHGRRSLLSKGSSSASPSMKPNLPHRPPPGALPSYLQQALASGSRPVTLAPPRGLRGRIANVGPLPVATSRKTHSWSRGRRARESSLGDARDGCERCRDSPRSSTSCGLPFLDAVDVDAHLSPLLVG